MIVVVNQNWNNGGDETRGIKKEDTSVPLIPGACLWDKESAVEQICQSCSRKAF